jgi:hypothetical protein
MTVYRTFCVVVASVLMVGACADAERRAPLSVESLAAGWSGGRTDPVCQIRGPRGEFLGTEPGAEYCQWPTLVQGRIWGTVGAYRDSANGYKYMRWERVFMTDTARARVIDSLSQEFRARGLQERPCGDRGHRWESRDFTIELTRVTRPDGSLMVSVFAAPIAGLYDRFCKRLRQPQRS